VSPLRKCLKHPASYLLLLALAAALIGADSVRAPDHQLVARIYVTAVRSYQRVGPRTLAGYVRCRYSPTCSRYSVEAVQRYGLRKGLGLTLNRLWRCRGSVPRGTYDAVP
jgi:putative membrane protein insertion efficiency factor